MNNLEQAARQALEALENRFNPKGFGEMDKAIDALRQALEQKFCNMGQMCLDCQPRGANGECPDQRPKQEPEFFTHNVEQPHDWSEWVCPNPKGYLMKCCDCGLVHEVEFGVVRFKSETELEDCEPVNDPNLQAVFRMRRSEQWLPEDTAHRAGGLPMAQPEQEPVLWGCKFNKGNRLDTFYTKGAAERFVEGSLRNGADVSLVGLYTEPPKREWVELTDEEIESLCWTEMDRRLLSFARYIEAKLKEKNA